MIYIETQSTSPTFNFAVEEYLCQSQLLTEPVFLFWQTEPTVMLGRYQNIYQEVDLALLQKDQIQLVRRTTGGGCIYTDLGGFQFSFIIPKNSQEIDFYDYLKPIINVLNKFHLDVTCDTRNDLLLHNKKISGNAQASRHGYTLHHGSLLFQTNLDNMTRYLKAPKYTMAQTGIQSVKSRVANITDYLTEAYSAKEFKDLFLHYLMANYPIQSYTLKPEEVTHIQLIQQQLFEQPDWLLGKNPPVSLTQSAKLKGGQLAISADVKAGLIQHIQFTGDFFTTGHIEQLEESLENCPFTYEAVKSKLLASDTTIYQITTEDILQLLFPTSLT